MFLNRNDNTVAFKVELISGEVFFLDVPEIDSSLDFLEIPIEAIALVTMPPTAESNGQPTQGLLDVGKYKSTEASLYVGKLGISTISQVMTESDMGRAILGSRSGIIL